MKKSEIAVKVFDTLDALPVANVAGGALAASVADLAALSLVPWFCDASIQWALRLTMPDSPLKKTLLKKVSGSFISEQNGVVLIGVPGDGIEPSTYTLIPLAEAVAKVTTPGMTLELAAANLGMVKRDWEVKAETDTAHGNQRYVGSVGAGGTWTIAQSTPALTRAQLESAVTCGRMVVQKGPWSEGQRRSGRHSHALASKPRGQRSSAGCEAVYRIEKRRVCEDGSGHGSQALRVGIGVFSRAA